MYYYNFKVKEIIVDLKEEKQVNPYNTKKFPKTVLVTWEELNHLENYDKSELEGTFDEYFYDSILGVLEDYIPDELSWEVPDGKDGVPVITEKGIAVPCETLYENFNINDFYLVSENMQKYPVTCKLSFIGITDSTNDELITPKLSKYDQEQLFTKVYKKEINDFMSIYRKKLINSFHTPSA